MIIFSEFLNTIALFFYQDEIFSVSVLIAIFQLMFALIYFTSYNGLYLIT